MYCFTYVNYLGCVVNELILWSDISSEHPIFIKTMAQLTKKDLPQNIIDELNEINKTFSDLEKRAETLKKTNDTRVYSGPNYIMELRDIVKRFLVHDRHVLEILSKVKEVGKEDKVWQTLLEHIQEEQTFMYELVCNLGAQIMA